MDDARPEGRPLAEGTAGHEANTLRVRGLVIFAVALAGMTTLVLLGLALLMPIFSSEEQQLEKLAPPRFAGDTGEFPAPKIQSDTASELTKMKKEDLTRLAEFGWIDRAQGIAHIPVDRAIDILAKNGLPATPPKDVNEQASDAAKSSVPEKKKAEPLPERKP
jgi:hypothetical protein